MFTRVPCLLRSLITNLCVCECVSTQQSYILDCNLSLSESIKSEFIVFTEPCFCHKERNCPKHVNFLRSAQQLRVSLMRG